AKAFDGFLKLVHFVSVDAQSDSGWDKLAALLAEGKDRIRAFYLAVAPELFAVISERIGKAGLVTKETRVICEKPIGRDLETAREVNDDVGKYFSERQIYRIDHYLGKE